LCDIALLRLCYVTNTVSDLNASLLCDVDILEGE
jgi:hypothetical protein